MNICTSNSPPSPSPKTLPDGWSYEAKVLEETLDLETKEGGEAFVIQDDFQNSYQKIRK